MKKIAFLTIAAMGLMANECGTVKTSNACDDYVNYMCDCSSEDCIELTNLYDEPTQEDLEACSQRLDEQQAEDEALGSDCEAESEDSGV